jgi:hypothetical protein
MSGRAISGAIMSLVAAVALAGCGPAGHPAPGTTRAKVDTSPTHVKETPWTFAVSGNHLVLPNGSQDTRAAMPGAACDSAEFAQDMSVGRGVAAGFTSAGFPAAAALLRHFLSGKGTEIDYRAGSPVSRQALASSAFRAVDRQVQGAILGQLKDGKAHVGLSAAQLPTVAFESTTSDLYWSFRGTQGLTVTGSGTREKAQYVGTLTYIIRDSYGFPADDALDGFGPPMRYLQTACGAPQTPGVPTGSPTPSR